MAYTEKYFISFCNPSGLPCRISVLEDDFIGVSTELVGQEDPITIEYDNSDDFKFKPIIESKATIGMVFDDDTLSFSELWTSNERTFKVEYFIDIDLEWTGFIIPEGFDYNLKGGKYEAIVTAQDGLSTLEGILFKTDNNEFYGTQDFGYNDADKFPYILIFTEILRKLDLGIDIWTLVDYYEQTMLTLNDDSRESDPLALSKVSVKTYINDTDREDVAYFEDINEAWDCKKIMETICYNWGARIYQQQGVWRVKSIHADSVIANPYTPEVDPFVGVNPTDSGIGTLYKYETYYSATKEIELDNTVFILSYHTTIGLNDPAFNDDFTDPALEGFYLLKGLNKVIYVNPGGTVKEVRNYQPVVTDYYWKKYNNTAGYLGRELADLGKVIPCKNKDIFLKDNDATIRMDKVYKQFRVNYDYTFVRVGDSPINLIKNGNFAMPFDQYGELEAPTYWERYRYNTKVYYPRGRVIELSDTDIEETNGNTHALEMFVQYNDEDTERTDNNPSVWASFAQLNIDFDKKVTALSFTGWIKYQFKIDQYFIFPVFVAYLRPVIDDGYYYMLENAKNEDYDFSWTKIMAPERNNPLQSSLDKLLKRRAEKFFWTHPNMGTRWIEAEQEQIKWYDFNLKIQPIPESGKLDFHIHGYAYYPGGDETKTFPAFPVKYPEGKKMVDKRFNTVRNMGSTGVPRPQYTGFEIAYIPDPEEEVPKTDYIYANGDINYTFQEDPIRIFNGDTTDPEIVSGIIVETNNIGRNKWDTFNNDFGKTDIGMILCKSVMQQYYKPKRLLDCDIKFEAYKYGDIIILEHIPGVKFIMLRGSKNEKKGYWEGCTLAEISNDNIAPGGIINGDSLDPEWQITGKTRCVKDGSGLNTGMSEYETLDINSNSESFGDYRWNDSGEDLTNCPIGEPSKYYWGTDVDDYDIENLTYFPISFQDDAIGKVQLSYSNTGDKYIYFLHLASLGSVTQVGNTYQSQIISSFTYIDDVTINGYLYRVLRQNFVTSEFEDLLLTYYIE